MPADPLRVLPPPGERPLPPLAPAPWDDAPPETSPGPAPWTALAGTFLWSPFGLVLLAFVAGAGWLVWTWHAGQSSGREPPLIAAEPPSRLASLYVESDLPEALVWVDGDSLGAAPVWTHDLAPGSAFVSVRAGAAQVDTLIRVVAGTDGRVSVRFPSAAVMAAEVVAPGGRPAPALDPEPALEPEPAPEPLPPSEPLAVGRPDGLPSAQQRPPARVETRGLGTIEVSAPAGSALFIDGQLRVPQAGALYRTQMPPGSYRVRSVHPTLGLAEQTVVVAPGVTFRVTFAPAAAAP